MKISIRFQTRVLTACLTLLLAAGTLRAQSYVPVPYNFEGMFEVTDDSVPLLQTPTDLSMDCLAANGYGQWTSSYKTQNAFAYDSGSPGLFLLANALRAPSYAGSNGIVSSRPFEYFDTTGYPVDAPTTNRGTVKCVANLKGRVRYVWPSADHSMFVVEGFNECPANDSTDGLTGINLEFSSYPYNASYGSGHQLLGKDVIKAPLPTNALTVNVSVLSHPIVTTAHEADPRDWFSISMDTTNLYIVYEEYDSTGHYNIWELTEQLDNGTPGPPILVASGARRPTVWADVRRAAPDTTTKACFDVAYITGILGGDHLTWYNYDGSRTPTADTMVMTKSCQDTAGGTWLYKKILHACILDASWEGIASSDTTPRAIYAIVADISNNDHLIMYKIKGGSQDAAAYYCDGTKLTNHAPGVNDGAFPVIDKPIRAFVNPYDGQKNDNFDEYHCMYQLARTYTGGSHRPLMMIHGAMVHDTLGPRACLNFAGLHLTPGTVTFRPDPTHAFYADPGLNTDGGDTDNYVGAVNQMGIHTHWRNGKEHYYLRDIRKFDEDIEENTLATEDVYVDDGTTHGGNYTPTVLPGKTMTLWTDRILPLGTRMDVPGLLFNLGECVLHFPDTGVNHASEKLIVGTGGDTSSKIVTVWSMNTFGDTTSQIIDIKPHSSLECHGFFYSPLNEVGMKLEGIGATMTGGTYNYPSSISSPAYLNLHGYSDFWPAFIVADSSIITCYYDQSADSLNQSNAGVTLNLVEASSITNSIVTNDAAISFTPFLEIIGVPNWQHSLDTNFILNTLVQKGVVGVDESIYIGSTGDTAFPALPLLISGGKFYSASIYAYCGPNATMIENISFDDTILPSGAVIWFENTVNESTHQPYETYDPITISGCQFLRIPTGDNGIYAQDYATDSSTMQNLHIIGNTFNYADGVHRPNAAIELQNSEALIEQNQIEGQFQYGIHISGYNSSTTFSTTSTMCSNVIRGGYIAGISTGQTAGYSELNNITVPGAAHISGVRDRSKIIYCNYSGNGGSGIVVSDSTGFPELSGVHTRNGGTGSMDIAAFDTISLNGGNAQISLVKGAHIVLGNDRENWTWTNWCQNNIYTMYSSDYCGCLRGGGGISYVPLIVVDSGNSITGLVNSSHNFLGDTTSAPFLPENQPTGTGCDSTAYNRGTPSSWLAGGDTIPIAAAGFCYDADTNYTTWQNRPAGPIDCSITLPTFEKTKQNVVKPLAILSDTSCKKKFAMGVSYIEDGTNNAVIDTGDSILMEYIETCYDTDQAYLAFIYLNGHGDSAGYATFREWLKSVLWLGPMYPGWYCYCAQDIYLSYEGFDAGGDLNASIAVIEYLDSSGRCNYAGDSISLVAQRHRYWLDTVRQLHHNDTIDFPEDTTIPTIDELGLQILRGPPAGVQDVPPSPTGISSLTASENPFKKETTISFETGEYAYISFQVFDVLGRVVQGDYKGAVQPPGAYSFTVDGANLASGTYYARITTPIGVTRTLKLVKE